MKTVLDIDKRLLLLINNNHCPWADKLMWFVSERLNKKPLQLIVFSLLYIIFSRRSPKLLIALIILLMLWSELAVLVVKSKVQRKRPFSDDKRVRIINKYKLTDASFYSAHAANSFVPVVMVASIIENRFIKILLYGIGALVSYSRIYLGQHYPSDVLVGVFAGSVFGKIGAALYSLLRGTKKL